MVSEGVKRADPLQNLRVSQAQFQKSSLEKFNYEIKLIFCLLIIDVEMASSEW